jgi:alpha-beta hydrolase superfamily lysophospholipase
VVKDLKTITENFSLKNPNIPTVVLGHSMGSFLTRSLIIDFPETANHYIFSATASHPGLKGFLGSFIAKSNSFLFGKKTKSRLLQLLVMGEFNKKIKKPKTRKDWISRDEKVVNDYINDPYCMQVFKNQFFVDLAFGVMSVNETKNILKMNKDKHYLFFSGSMDPVGNYGKGVQKLYMKFIATGLTNTEIKLFDEGRHEMLNEINKQEVYQYIYNWIDKKILNGK